MADLSINSEISRVRTDYGDVLLDEGKGFYWHANPTAVLVLDTIADGGGTEQAVERLVEEFGIDQSAARSDTATLLRRLRELGVVR